MFKETGNCQFGICYLRLLAAVMCILEQATNSHWSFCVEDAYLKLFIFLFHIDKFTFSHILGGHNPPVVTIPPSTGNCPSG